MKTKMLLVMIGLCTLIAVKSCKKDDLIPTVEGPKFGKILPTKDTTLIRGFDSIIQFKYQGFYDSIRWNINNGISITSKDSIINVTYTKLGKFTTTITVWKNNIDTTKNLYINVINPTFTIKGRVDVNKGIEYQGWSPEECFIHALENGDWMFKDKTYSSYDVQLTGRSKGDIVKIKYGLIAIKTNKIWSKDSIIDVKLTKIDTTINIVMNPK